MAVLQEYKCPCCDGAVGFDSTVQKMKCPYCDTEFDVEALSEYNKQLETEDQSEMNWDKEAGAEWTDGETDGLRSYVCNSCGGEIVGDENTGATSCPFCGNPVVMTGQFSGALKPDYVIPFKLDKNAAKEALKNHYKKKWFLPKVFKDENHIDEIKGIYVPFWLFDADVDANVKFKATKVKRWSDSNYIYKRTSYYSVEREGSLAFEAVPVDGSEKIQDELMESIEPFDKTQAVDFQTAYLAGFFADKYDVSVDESIDRANQRIKSTTTETLKGTVNGYNTVTEVSSVIKLNNGSSKYALYPVWLLTTNWNGQKYTFAMNGQTGKFVGDLPVDKNALLKWRLGLTAAIGAVVFAASWLFWLI